MSPAVTVTLRETEAKALYAHLKAVGNAGAGTLRLRMVRTRLERVLTKSPAGRRA